VDAGDDDVFRCLLALGYRISEARWAIARCGEMEGATEEQRVKRAARPVPATGESGGSLRLGASGAGGGDESGAGTQHGAIVS
jgi:hypothetical protein